MKKRSLKFTFHNPNTDGETIEYISALLAEVAVSKIIKKTQEIHVADKEEAIS